ncbi:MAG: hypothetical protein ACT4O1_03525 [Gemmatimonadota bacterium]
MPAPADPAISEELIWKLWAEQFKQLSWLAVVAAGGGLVLLQAGFWRVSGFSVTALGSFAVAAVTAVLGQSKLADRLARQRPIDGSLYSYRQTVELLLGVGVGAAICEAAIRLIWG